MSLERFQWECLMVSVITNRVTRFIWGHFCVVVLCILISIWVIPYKGSVKIILCPWLDSKCKITEKETSVKFHPDIKTESHKCWQYRDPILHDTTRRRSNLYQILTKHITLIHRPHTNDIRNLFCKYFIETRSRAAEQSYHYGFVKWPSWRISGQWSVCSTDCAD